MHVEAAVETDIDDILELVRGLGGELNRDHWSELLRPKWPGAETLRGWVLRSDQRAVGFLGALVSERAHGSRTRRFAKLSSWIVAPEARAASLMLLQPLRSLSDMTLVNFSPTMLAAKAFKRFGFRPLEQQLVIAPYFGWPSAEARRARARELEQLLDPHSMQVHRDHQRYNCKSILITGRGRNCYLLCSPTRLRRKLRVAYIHHVSSPELLCRYQKTIQKELYDTFGTRFMAIDQRLLVGEKLRHAYVHNLIRPRFYRPAANDDVPPHEVDSAYSECVVLDSERWVFNY
jgi:hypothetical protein